MNERSAWGEGQDRSGDPSVGAGLEFSLFVEPVAEAALCHHNMYSVSTRVLLVVCLCHVVCLYCVVCHLYSLYIAVCSHYTTVSWTWGATRLTRWVLVMCQCRGGEASSIFTDECAESARKKPHIHWPHLRRVLGTNHKSGPPTAFNQISVSTNVCCISCPFMELF